MTTVDFITDLFGRINGRIHTLLPIGLIQPIAKGGLRHEVIIGTVRRLVVEVVPGICLIMRN